MSVSPFWVVAVITALPLSLQPNFPKGWPGGATIVVGMLMVSGGTMVCWPRVVSSILTVGVPVMPAAVFGWVASNEF